MTSLKNIILLAIFITANPLYSQIKVDTLYNQMNESSFTIEKKQGEQLIERNQFIKGKIVEQTNFDGEKIKQLIYYPNGKIEFDRSFIKTNHAYFQEDHHLFPGYMPFDKTIQYNLAGDTILVDYFNSNNIDDHIIYEDYLPYKTIRFTYLENRQISKRTQELLLNREEGLVPTGWQISYENGIYTKEFLAIPSTRKLKAYWQNENGETPFPIIRIQQDTSGCLLSKLNLNEDGLIRYTYKKDGSITTIQTATFNYYKDQGAWEKTRYYYTKKDFVETNDYSSVEFHEKNPTIPFIIHQKTPEGITTESYQFYSSGVLKSLIRKKQLVLYNEKGQQCIELKTDFSPDVNTDNIFQFVDIFPKYTKGKPIDSTQIKSFITVDGTIFFYKNKLVGYKKTANHSLDEIVEVSYILPKGKTLKSTFKNNGVLIQKDSADYQTNYTYHESADENHLIKKTVKQLNKTIYSYANNSALSPTSYEVTETYHDPTKDVDSIVFFSYNPLAYNSAFLTGEDSVQFIQIIKNKTNQTYKYTIDGHLISYENQSPFSHQNDTLFIRFDAQHNSVEIALIDTASHQVLNVSNHPDEFTAIDSSLTQKNEWNNQLIWQKTYYKNGQLFVDRDKDKFNVYYPNGILASDDNEFNNQALSAKSASGKDYSFLLYRFNFENDVFGRSSNQISQQNIQFSRPTLLPKSGNVSVVGDPNLKYLLFNINDFQHLYDKKNGAFAAYHLFLTNFRYSRGTHATLMPTNHPELLTMSLDDGTLEKHIVRHNGDQLEFLAENNACIDPTGKYLFKLTYRSEDENHPLNELKAELIAIENDSTLLSFKLDTAELAFKPLPLCTIEFLDNNHIYTNLFSSNNIISIPKKARVKTMTKNDYELFWNHMMINYNSNSEKHELFIQDAGERPIEVVLDQVLLEKQLKAKYYAVNQTIYLFTEDNQFYTYHIQDKKLTLFPNKVIGVYHWGNTPSQTELIIDVDNKLYRHALITGKQKPLYFEKQPIDALRIDDHQLTLHQNKFNTLVDISGLKKSSDALIDIPLEVYWESAFIDKKLIFKTQNIHAQAGKHIYFTEDSSAIYFWNSNKKNRWEQHIELMPLSNSGHVFITPDNYYWLVGSDRKQVYFEKELKIYPLEQFDLKYNRPDIILDRLGYADSSLIAAYHAAYLKRLKKMGFTEDMLEDDFHLPEIKIENFEEMPTLHDQGSIDLKLKLEDSKYKLDRINVWVNDVAVYGSDGISLRDKNVQDYSTTLKVDLAKGKNKVQVSVLNQAGTESYKETFEIECTAGKKEPNLYLITIGESEFEQADFNLTYAAKDAQDIATLFQKSKAYAEVKTKTLVNQEVTKENVIALKSFLAKADINDEVMIFIAGHGVLDANLDYFFATYDMDFVEPNKKGLAYEDVERLLDGIKPLKKTLLIDACHSGEIDKDEVLLAEAETETAADIQFRAVGNTATPKLGTQNTSELTKSLFTDLRKGTGATVISSAGGMEFAMEGDDWQNGLFTYCFINGIKTKAADYDKNGEIWLSEIKRYVSEQVTELSNGKQQPTSRIENQSVDFRVW